MHEHVLCRSAAHGKHVQHPPRAWLERLAQEPEPRLETVKQVPEPDGQA
jgi:hypothetical protein